MGRKSMIFTGAKRTILVAAILSLHCICYAQKVTEVVIKGNKNVKDREIKSELTTKKKKAYSYENIKEDISSVMKMGYFNDVSVELDTETYKVTYTVEEKPMVDKIEFKGIRWIYVRSRDKVIVATGFQSGPLSGGGNEITLEKTDTGWKITGIGFFIS